MAAKAVVKALKATAKVVAKAKDDDDAKAKDDDDAKANDDDDDDNDSDGEDDDSDNDDDDDDDDDANVKDSTKDFELLPKVSSQLRQAQSFQTGSVVGVYGCAALFVVAVAGIVQRYR